jgi:excisionase family DNA binding protein
MTLVLLTEGEAAELLRVSTRTLRSARQAGRLPCVRIGKCVRYTVADVESFVQSNRQANDERRTRSAGALRGRRQAQSPVPFSARREGRL